MDVQQAITQIRAAGYTQKQIAERLGVAQSSVCAYARGLRGVRRGVSYELMSRVMALRDQCDAAKPPRQAA